MTAPDAGHYDVFLSHNARDKPAVERLARRLVEGGLRVWLDSWRLTPGGHWQEELVAGLNESAACAVCLGPHGLGDWMREEVEVALSRAAKERQFRLFLVLLPDALNPSEAGVVPAFLRSRTWVNLRAGLDDADGLRQLDSAIRGVAGGAPAAGVAVATSSGGVALPGPASAASPGPMPPAPPVAPLRHNLPAPTTRFIGRAAEMARVTGLLGEARLLTLTGAGGTGKTRLALEVAAGLVDASPDGVWLVELAPLADAALVAQAVAGALGVREEPGRPLRATLLDALRPRRLLLLLDNCEHLIDACAALAAALLAGCPQVRLLATSRELLGVPGEAAYPVPSLAVPPAPPPGAGAQPVDQSRAAVLGYEAAQLFCDRAALASPAFALTDDNAAAVAQVCARLDGIPLALELAAARVRSLSVEAVAARLDDRFRLLTGGSRTALRRQQTLRALIDWSHDLLAEAERALLRRLSVFAGGFTLEAAEEVCAGGEVAGEDVFDLLTRLVDKSLVLAEAAVGEARYRLLETIRQYAGEKLLDAGEAAATRARHRDAFLALAERAMPGLWGSEQGIWFDRLETEHENLRAALEWSHGDPDGAAAEVRLAGALGQFWHLHGHNQTGTRYLAAALARGGEVPPGARALALHWVGRIETLLGNIARGQALVEEALPLARAAGDLRLVAHILRHLSDCRRGNGGPAEALALIEEAVRTARADGAQRELAWSLINLANQLKDEGDLSARRLLIEESLAISRATGDWNGLRAGLISFAALAAGAGDRPQAKAAIEECQALVRRFDFLSLDLMGHGRLADLIGQQGDHTAARATYRDTLVNARRQGARAITATTLMCLAFSEAAQGRTARASRLLGAIHASRDVAFAFQPWLIQRYANEMAALRATLGETAFAVAWADGQALTMDDVVEEELATGDAG